MKSFFLSDPSFLSLRMFDDDSRFERNTNRASFTCRATENKLRTTHVTFRSCLLALNSHPTTLIEIAVYSYYVNYDDCGTAVAAFENTLPEVAGYSEV